MPSEHPRNAYVFPGQGSQSVGMGRGLHDADPIARVVWEEADDLLGLPLSRLAFEGPQQELNRTENAQPALLTASIAAYEVLRSRRLAAPPLMAAGHSLGEYSALVAAGAFRFGTALRLVRLRGELMAAEGERTGGAMLAVIGLPAARLNALCSQLGVDVANYNSPDQTVISGPIDAVQEAGERAREAGARRVVPLAVSGAFHSHLMRPAAAAFEEAVRDIPLSTPSITVIGNVEAKPLISTEDIRRELVLQIWSPVRWSDTLERIAAEGIEQVVEVGPGKVLSALVRRTLPGVQAVTSDDLLAAGVAG